MSGNGRGETIREEAVNTLLARLLAARGVRARAERRSREGAPDVRAELRTGDSLLLECKWDGDERALRAQLDERLAQFPEALAAVGVTYPSRIRRAADAAAALEDASDLRWLLHGSRGERRPEGRWRDGSAEELADWLRALPLELEGSDRVAAAAGAIGYALERSAVAIAAHARVARRVSDLIASTDRERDRAAAVRIGCLVLFNALAFQDRLAAVHPDAPSVAEARRAGPASGLAGLRDAWRAICERIDYVPVFELAADILDAVADAPEDTQRAALEPLARAMEQTRRLEGHDLSGRLFHTLLTDAKFTGAYYTSVPAATLLARLAFEGWPPGVDWSDHEFPASLSVADLACGTGTLLMAVAEEARRRHEDAGGARAAELHKAMVEQALHGYDVQLSAVHFAATSLAMLNPDVQFDRMNLYRMYLGVGGERVSLGSLDFLAAEEVPVQMALSPAETGVEAGGAERVSGGGLRGAEEGQTARLPELDLAIMNPPFTRSGGGNLLFGSLPAGERRALQDELSRRLRERRATATAGLGAAFVAAAAPRLRRGEGRLALVLPAVVSTGSSWASTRALIGGEFALDTVIASHDPLRWNFSDSTALSEVLLIATRRPEADGEDGEDERRTTFVNLWRNPDGVLDAHRVARAVAATPPARIEDAGAALLEVDGVHVGEAFTTPEPGGRGGQWSGVQFARADVVRAARRLLDDGLVMANGGGGGDICSDVPARRPRRDRAGPSRHHGRVRADGRGDGLPDGGGQRHGAAPPHGGGAGQAPRAARAASPGPPPETGRPAVGQSGTAARRRAAVAEHRPRRLHVPRRARAVQRVVGDRDGQPDHGESARRLAQQQPRPADPAGAAHEHAGRLGRPQEGGSRGAARPRRAGARRRAAGGPRGAVRGDGRGGVRAAAGDGALSGAGGAGRRRGAHPRSARPRRPAASAGLGARGVEPASVRGRGGLSLAAAASAPPRSPRPRRAARRAR